MPESRSAAFGFGGLAALHQQHDFVHPAAGAPRPAPPEAAPHADSARPPRTAEFQGPSAPTTSKGTSAQIPAGPSTVA